MNIFCHKTAKIDKHCWRNQYYLLRRCHNSPLLWIRQLAININYIVY